MKDQTAMKEPAMTHTIRDAKAADKVAWLGLWQAYLDFYQTTLPQGVTDQTWTRLLDPASTMKMRLAEADGATVGFAIHQHHPSSWVMGEDCYLEDLFVQSQVRGQGVGRALIEDLKTLARARGWHRLYWHTNEGNTAARRLYDSFTASDGHIRYRLKL